MVAAWDWYEGLQSTVKFEVGGRNLRKENRGYAQVPPTLASVSRQASAPKSPWALVCYQPQFKCHNASSITSLARQ